MAASNALILNDEERLLIMLLRQRSQQDRHRLLSNLIQSYVDNNENEQYLQQAIQTSMEEYKQQRDKEAKEQENDHAIAIELQQQEQKSQQVWNNKNSWYNQTNNQRFH